MKKLFNTIISKLLFLALPLLGGVGGGLLLTSCGEDHESAWVENPEQPGNTDQPGTETPGLTQNGYNEPNRPQIHYTPKQNWVNDPNGMVYKDGTWHLFYQYNPYGNDWGNMSWGHATSTDLVHWQEQPVALTKGDNTCGDIFSGSCVVDKDNTAGFGAGAIVAIYTGNDARQQQCIAYSTDNGKTFTNYSGNPVIANTSREHFRDPKVFWDEQAGQWVMSLALGTEYGVEFYGSKDLKNWQMLSQFKYPSCMSSGNIQWECPDLFKLGEKWVLIVSVNPGGLNGGSGTMYFVGDWDGKKFKALDQNYPLWLDTGADNYAGATFSNAPDNRRILIGWMNNWSYVGASPVSPWRSAFTLPRDLSLVNVNGQYRLASVPSKEVETLAGEWKEITGGSYKDALAGNVCSHLKVEISKLTDGTITLSNSKGEQYVITLNSAANLLLVARGKKTGNATFNGTFSLPAIKSELNSLPLQGGAGGGLTLDIFIDQSSVEIFSADGLLVQTNTVYPKEAYNAIDLKGIDAKVKVRPLKSIWQTRN